MTANSQRMDLAMIHQQLRKMCDGLANNLSNGNLSESQSQQLMYQRCQEDVIKLFNIKVAGNSAGSGRVNAEGSSLNLDRSNSDGH